MSVRGSIENEAVRMCVYVSSVLWFEPSGWPMLHSWPLPVRVVDVVCVACLHSCDACGLRYHVMVCAM